MATVALELNAAGDMALVESGFIGMDDFSDPNLAKWAVDIGVEGTGWDHVADDVNRGDHIVQKLHSNHARYIASPISPTIILPTDRMQVTMLCTFDEDGSAFFNYDCTVLNACKAVAEADAQNYGVAYNKVWFGPKKGWGHRYNGTLQEQTTGTTNGHGTTPRWLGTLTDPEGSVCGYPGEVCPAGYNLHCTHAMSGEAWICSEPGAGGWCEADLFGRTGWPAWGSYKMNNCSPPFPPNRYGYIYEFWAWKWPWIEVRCVPSGYYVKIVQDAGHATSHPTYTLPGETKTSSVAPGSGWVADEGGYTHDRICVYGGNATPPFQRVEIRRQGDDDLLASIEPSAFQPGVFGGDVYTLCMDDLIAPCPPYSETTNFFFGGRISPTTMLRATAKLDAILVEGAPPADPLPGDGYGSSEYGGTRYGE